MKKIFLSLVISVISVISYGQKIIKDIVNNDIRIVETSSVCGRSFTDRVVWNFGLEGHININDTTNIQYLLGINLNAMSKIPIKDKGTLLIKTFDNNIIELSNLFAMHNGSKIIGYSYHKPLIGNVGTISSNEIHRNIAYFIINEEQINLIKSGIIKVRIETDNGYVEKEYKKDKCGEYLYNSYKLIKNQIISTNAPSIKDDF